MSETLTNMGTEKVDANEETNVTGQMTPILEFSPNDSLVLRLSNMGGQGIPIFAELRDSNGDLLPLDTNFTLRGDSPIFDQPKVVAHTKSNIQVYRTLDIKEQQNTEYKDRTRLELKGRHAREGLRIEDVDTLEVAIESSAQIDWDESRVFIDEKAVTVETEN
jgi:hypothetical protein